MITYTHRVGFKCKCKWRIPFQFQLSSNRIMGAWLVGLAVCLCATDRATRSDVKVSVLFPSSLFFLLFVAFAFGSYAIVARRILPHDRQEVHLSLWDLGKEYHILQWPHPRHVVHPPRPPLLAFFLLPRAKMRQKFYEVRVKMLLLL